MTAELRAVSPNGQSLYEGGLGLDRVRQGILRRLQAGDDAPASDEFAGSVAGLQMYDKQPLRGELSGLNLEYRIIQLYSRDAGKREAKISFNVGQGTQDIGSRNDADVLFTCLPASEVTFRVRDENKAPATAMFVIRDKQDRVYPSQAGALCPTSAFIPRSIGPTARRKNCRRGNTRWNTARPGIPDEDAVAQGGGPNGRMEFDLDSPDRSLQAWLVVGRPSHPCRRVRPLHRPDRRRAAVGYDPGLPG